MKAVVRRMWIVPVALSIFGAMYYATGLSTNSRVFSDFYGNVWWPGHRILGGAAGFPNPPTGWPATATAAVTPFALLPEWLALSTWVVLSIGAFLGSLWLLGCRDPRVLAVAILSPPALGCLVLGNMTLFLVAGVAVVWACRDRPLLSGTAAGLSIVLKLWLWPLVVFLLITRRWASATTAALWCAGAAAAWWLLSPETLRGFDDRSDETLARFAHWGMGITALALNTGASLDAAKLIAPAVALCVIVGAWRSKTEHGAFTLCLAAALCASPIVWVHYYAILFVPVAIVSPRASALWFAPYLCGAGLLWPEGPREFAVASAVSLSGLVLTVALVMRFRTPAASPSSTILQDEPEDRARYETRSRARSQTQP